MAKLVQGVCSILATFFIARHLGPTTFGELSLAIAAASMVGAAGALGLEQVATREMASEQDLRSTLAVLYRVRLGGAITGSFALLAAGLFPQLHPEGTGTLLLILSLLPIVQAGDVSEWRLVAAERSHRVAVVVLVVSPLAAVARLALVLYGASVGTFAWALVAEWLARSVLMTRCSHGEPIPSTPDQTFEFYGRAKALLRDSMPFLLAGLAVFIYMRIDQFMIAAVLGSEDVGHYSAAVVLSEAPLVIPVLLLRASLPKLTREFQANPQTGERTLLRLMRFAFYLHLAGAVVVAALADPIVQLLYGEAYGQSAAVLRIQAFGAPFVALGVISGAWIVFQRSTKYALVRTVAGAVVNIVANVVLIPLFGIEGAAVATILAFATAAFLMDASSRSTRPLFRLKVQALAPGAIT